MNPSSSLHGLNIVVFQEETHEDSNSAVTSTLRTIMPVQAEAGNYGRWKLAAMLLVALPVVLWLVVALLT